MRYQLANDEWKRPALVKPPTRHYLPMTFSAAVIRPILGFCAQ
jgi:hypothetical protein